MTAPVFAIGIMSGTSVDAIDAVILELSDFRQPELVASHCREIPPRLRDDILLLTRPGPNEIDRAGRLHVELAIQYGEAVSELISLAGFDSPDAIKVIGCHGQTVRHRPNLPHPFTLQLGSGAVLSEITRIPTVTDFRSADIAAGGQGAPFAPFFHQAVFSKPGCQRAIVNLGGIANITLLDGNDAAGTIGFDTGPANGLMDAWIHRHQQQRFDRDGRWARSGSLNPDLLNRFLGDPYFHKKPPKSTGREHFNLDWVEHHCNEFGQEVAPEDVQHTLGRLTASSIAAQIPATVDQVFLCGGGCLNTWLVEQISMAINQDVLLTDALGINTQWVESAAFAWLGYAALERKAVTLPRVTGASHSVICGAVYFPAV